jgi:integrase
LRALGTGKTLMSMSACFVNATGKRFAVSSFAHRIYPGSGRVRYSLSAAARTSRSRSSSKVRDVLRACGRVAFSTATSYLSLSNSLRVRWGTFKLGQFKPLGFQNWLKSLEVKPKNKGHLKAFVHRLFNKAKLYGMVEFHENPIAFVEVRGISKRSRKPVDLTIHQFLLILRLVPKSYQDMLLVAQCTELRVGELLALQWEEVNFERLCIKVKEGVNGRIGPVKTEYSEDELPMDPDFATVLLEIKWKSNGFGLLFPNPTTGLSYHASLIQQDDIRRAGWCLVACPGCGGAPGIAGTGVDQKRGKRHAIPVHEERRQLQPRTISAASDGIPSSTPIGPCSAAPIPRSTSSKSCFVTPTSRPRSSMAVRLWRTSGGRTAMS